MKAESPSVRGPAAAPPAPQSASSAGRRLDLMAVMLLITALVVILPAVATMFLLW